MRLHPILVVPAALLLTVITTCLVVLALIPFGFLAMIGMMLVLALGVALGTACLVARSPMALVCFGAPFSPLLATYAQRSWAGHSTLDSNMDAIGLGLGISGFLAVYYGYLMAMSGWGRKKG